MSQDIRAALEYAAELKEVSLGVDPRSQMLVLEDGRQFDKFGNALIPPIPDSLVINSLTGFANYVNQAIDLNEVDGLMIIVNGSESVSLVGSIDKPWMQRTKYVVCRCDREYSDNYTDVGVPTMISYLQTNFEKTDNRDLLIKLISSVKADEGIDATDDGLSQRVVTRSSVTKVGQEEVPNPIVLKPLRIFPELDQPESPFLVRLDKMTDRRSESNKTQIVVSLKLADNDAWRETAMDGIRNFLASRITRENILIV